jgi:hypothetical protein
MDLEQDKLKSSCAYDLSFRESVNFRIKQKKFNSLVTKKKVDSVIGIKEKTEVS